LMIDGDTRDIFTSIGGVLYHIPTCEMCGMQWCGGRATEKNLPSDCARQHDGDATTGEWMSAHPSSCPASDCAGTRDYQKLQIDGVNGPIYTSVGGELKYVSECTQCGQNWCGRRALDRMLDHECVVQPDGDASSDDWLRSHVQPCPAR
jgi:hypothetical protein